MSCLHEFIHILGFSNALFAMWIDERTNQPYLPGTFVYEEIIRNYPSTILTTPNVVNTARKYYNCSSLRGM